MRPMSKYFHITPIEGMSNSWRWFVDEAGLEYAKNKYQSYEKHGIIKDRWETEFIYEEVKELPVDFGGLECTTEPRISIKDDGIQYTMKVHHLPYFIEALQWDGDEKYKIAGITSILMKWWRIAIALETGNRVLMKAMELQKNCEEMLEGVNKNWEEFYEQMAKHGHLIRIKPAHDH